MPVSGQGVDDAVAQLVHVDIILLDVEDNSKGGPHDTSSIALRSETPMPLRMNTVALEKRCAREPDATLMPKIAPSATLAQSLASSRGQRSDAPMMCASVPN